MTELVPTFYMGMKVYSKGPLRLEKSEVSATVRSHAERGNENAERGNEKKRGNEKRLALYALCSLR
jgi:hypothetical protein